MNRRASDSTRDQQRCRAEHAQQGQRPLLTRCVLWCPSQHQAQGGKGWAKAPKVGRNIRSLHLTRKAKTGRQSNIPWRLGPAWEAAPRLRGSGWVPGATTQCCMLTLPRGIHRSGTAVSPTLHWHTAETEGKTALGLRAPTSVARHRITPWNERDSGHHIPKLRRQKNRPCAHPHAAGDPGGSRGESGEQAQSKGEFSQA